ncbi:hypothetical protein BKA66DRAFT_601818 [Pyrenochaeta sp. MPI-SDFR-AT-0127]|nr:hypothetical protein BKA66DRAFT_601818 [Pyrenochaeta sp. MPI-SDFR-AT-0127]
MFSGKWGDKQEDDSYFIETDAHIFEHILRYLRTGVLPVFYDKVAGHYFPLYQALLEESMYFAIDRLQKWLRERKYLAAVNIHIIATEAGDRDSYSKHTVKGPDGRTFMIEDRFIDMTTSSNMETTVVPVTQQRNTFYCPEARHGKSSPDHCWRCIGQAREDGIPGYGGWKQEEQLTWCIVRKEVVFNHDLCVTAFLEDS